MLRSVCRLLGLAMLLVASPAFAHLGSPDTFVQTSAGPYRVLVAAHPPAVFPGPLEVDLRVSPEDQINHVEAALDRGVAAPVRVFADGTAAVSLWTADGGAHTLRVRMHGARGEGALTLELSSTAKPAGANGRWWVWGGAGCCAVIAVLLLLAGWKRTGMVLLLVGIVLLGVGMVLRLRAAKKCTFTATLLPGGKLRLQSSAFRNLAPDHGKLMHLFAIREPQQDVILHLHPVSDGDGIFVAQLPAMPPGTYELFADVVHLEPGASSATATSETLAITLELPAQLGASSGDGDDSGAVLPPVNRASAVTSINGAVLTEVVHLPDGYAMRLTTDAKLQPLRAHLLTVEMLDAQGQAVEDPALYLGMAAHTLVLRRDNAVFAHIHPGGTLPMLMDMKPQMPGMWMPGDPEMPKASNRAVLPYGFPLAGLYRIFVQMKHGTKVETAAFDLTVSE